MGSIATTHSYIFIQLIAIFSEIGDKCTFTSDLLFKDQKACFKNIHEIVGLDKNGPVKNDYSVQKFKKKDPEKKILWNAFVDLFELKFMANVKAMHKFST